MIGSLITGVDGPKEKAQVKLRWTSARAAFRSPRRTVPLLIGAAAQTFHQITHGCSLTGKLAGLRYLPSAGMYRLLKLRPNAVRGVQVQQNGEDVLENCGSPPILHQHGLIDISSRRSRRFASVALRKLSVYSSSQLQIYKV